VERERKMARKLTTQKGRDTTSDKTRHDDNFEEEDQGDTEHW
jgi:hypothetical protein